jgi:hypothetical protein
MVNLLRTPLNFNPSKLFFPANHWFEKKNIRIFYCCQSGGRTFNFLYQSSQFAAASRQALKIETKTGKEKEKNGNRIIRIRNKRRKSKEKEERLI